jgi:glycolate oxidase iron-sulfur subunit
MKESLYLSELMKCVRCGSCSVSCPTYDQESTEGMTARGRLALLWALSSGQCTPSKVLYDRVFSCTLCGQCTASCPLGVDIKELIYHGRTLLMKSDPNRKILRLLTRTFLRRAKLGFKVLGLTQHLVLPYLSKKKLIPDSLEVPDTSLKERFQVFTVLKKRGRVAVFAGCTVNFLLPHLGEALIHVLFTLGYEVILLPGEVCCGAPFRTLGLEKEAVRCAEKNTEIFNKLHVDALLSLCPTCILTLKSQYPGLIGKGIPYATDISSFLADKIDDSVFPPLPLDNRKIKFHDPCHLRYGLGIEKEPRDILGMLGIELLKSNGVGCCGFAGTFSLSFPDLSQGMLAGCMKEYAAQGTEMLITACPGCMLQLNKSFAGKPVLHLIEVIEESLLQKP